MNRYLFLLFIVLSCMTCKQVNPNFQSDAENTDYLHRSMNKLTEVIVHDIFSPPVASRIYAYPSIAAYEVMQQSFPDYRSLSVQLTDLMPIRQADQTEEYCFPLASTQAFLVVSKALIFSEKKIEDFHRELLEEFEALNMPSDVFQRSVDYGNEVAQHILAWADKDNYKQTRTFNKYTITDEVAEWKPTPPSYMDGIEPHWREIRPFVIDSAQQFVPKPPTAFDMNKESQFYKELMEVYHALDAKDKDERIAIASFWDCNPYVSHQKGHMMFATKKITPGGHWIGITELATKKKKSNFMATTEAYARVSIALADAFISCWDEKYRSNLIRPETVINEYLDESWMPALQTPPFPEYTSGHSVISRAAAITLTDIFGDNFAYDDTVEEKYGLPTRSYTSFLQASEEAAISRLYGGIHYRPAIDEGVKQGEQVGKYILQKLQTRESRMGMK